MKISELLVEKDIPQSAKDLKARRQMRSALAQNNKAVNNITNPKDPSIAKSPKSGAPRWFAKKSAKYKAYSDSVDRRVAVKMAKWGTMTKWLFRAISLLGPTVQLYTDLETLDEDYKKGDDPDLQNVDDLKANREFAWGIWAAQATVAVAQMVAAGRIALILARFLKWVIGGVGVVAGVATAGAGSAAAIAAMIGTEAVFTAFEMWLGSDQGKDWIANTFLRGIVTGVGSVPDAVWDKARQMFTGSSYYKTANQGKVDQAKKDGKEVKPTDQDPEAYVRYINGIQVTSSNGQVDPERLKHPKVKFAIDQAKKQNPGKSDQEIIQMLIANDPYNKDKVPLPAQQTPVQQAPATPAPAAQQSQSAPASQSSNTSGAAWKPIIAY